MQNRFLNFIRKYWLSILLSLIMVLGITLSIKYSYLYQSDSEVFPFDLSTVYLLCVIPIYSLIYGCLSYVKAKKVWVPQLILYTATFIYFFAVRSTSEVLLDILLFSMYPVAFSLIGSSITAFICYIVKKTKEDMK